MSHHAQKSGCLACWPRRSLVSVCVPVAARTNFTFFFSPFFVRQGFPCAAAANLPSTVTAKSTSAIEPPQTEKNKIGSVSFSGKMTASYALSFSVECVSHNCNQKQFVCRLNTEVWLSSLSSHARSLTAAHFHSLHHVGLLYPRRKKL